MVKRMLVLVSGTGFAQLVPIFTAPIVARLYSPEDFGLYAIFYSLVTILTGLTFLEFNNIIIIAKNNKIALGGFTLSIVVSAIFNLVVFFFINFLTDEFKTVFFGKEILPYLWLIPFSVFFGSLNNLFYLWFLRNEDYKLLSYNKIFLSICSVFLQIGFGLLYIGVIGFILANLILILISIVSFSIKFKYNWRRIFMSFSILKKLAIEHKKFPLISVWGNTLNIITLQIPQFFLNKLFGAQVLGQYSLGQRMITLPLGLVANAIQDVFRQAASKEENEIGNFTKSYQNTFKISSIIAIIMFISCLTFIPSLFVWVFGSKWADAGIYVRVLALLLVVRFVVAPLSYSLYLKSKQQIDLLWQIGLFLITIFTLYGGYYWFNIQNDIYLLLIYSITITLWYGINLIITYKLSKEISN
jgi:O-antigen/teichoic acid export membrane protein